MKGLLTGMVKGEHETMFAKWLVRLREYVAAEEEAGGAAEAARCAVGPRPHPALRPPRGGCAA